MEVTEEQQFLIDLGIYEIKDGQVRRSGKYMDGKEIAKKIKEFQKNQAKKEKEAKLRRRANKREFLRKNNI